MRTCIARTDPWSIVEGSANSRDWLPDGSGIRNYERIMEIEKYTITYKIGNDIPINPAWIREQLQAAVAKLQAEIDKKNTHGQHVLEFK